MAFTVPQRYRALDGLRGGAALLVVFLHIDWTNHLTDNNFVKNGYLAVDLFFMLSGFVIAANYSARIFSLSDIGRFLTVRFFRLYPLHLTMLGAFVVLECAKLIANVWLGISFGEQVPFTNHNSLEALLANLFLVQALNLFDTPTWNGPSWSISCEYTAYVVFSFAFLFGAIKSRLYVSFAFIASIVGYLSIALARETLDVTTDWSIVRCLAGFFVGTWLFEISKRGILAVPRWGELVVGAAILITMGAAKGWFVVFIVPLFGLLILSIQTDTGPLARVLISPLAQFLGRVSYSVYMVHQLFIVIILISLKRLNAGPVFISPEGRTTISLNPWLGDSLALVLFAATLVTAIIAYAYIEEPGRLFGRRLVKFQAVARTPVAGEQL